MKNPIIFYKGDENGIVVEKKYYEYSLFTNQYKKAFEVFNRIWNVQEPMITGTQGEKKDTYRGMDNRFSNIISFCGDRGEGKSSCMSSFTAMLTEPEARNSAVASKIVDDKFVDTEKIELIDFIDPSFFDEQHNVLELLLGRMYTSVNRINTQNKNYEAQLYKIRQLREQFQKVKTSLAILHKKDEKNYLENLEELDELAAGIRLKAELDELFRLYLKFVNKERILICIDDMDLNMSQGYKMAELVRKYLIGKYCIILISVKIEQLVDIVAVAMDHAVQGKIDDLEIQNMAQKYVTKLLPQSNCVYMPSPEDFCNRKLVIHDPSDGSLLQEEIDNARVLLKDYVVRLIFQKTRYVFYNGRSLSPIIPTNLRSLRHFVAALAEQEDAKIVVSNSGECEEKESNRGRELFTEYLFGTWAECLAEIDYNFAQQMLAYSDVLSLNKFVLDHFIKRVQEEGIKDFGDDNRQDLYETISKKENCATNITFGDVMFVLWSVDKVTMSQSLKNLIFLIKTYYSMQLYKYYNQVSIDKDSLYNAKLTEGVRIYKEDKAYENINAYQRFVNGSMFTYPNGEFLPSEKYGPSRDTRLISFDSVQKLFKQLNNEGNTKSDEYIKLLRLCEFMALTISGTTTMDEQEKNSDVGYDRTALKSPYLGEFSPSSKTAVFDVLYPFYALSNIKYTYGRYDTIMGNKDALYNLAFENKESLLCKLYERVITERNKRSSKDGHWSLSEWNKIHSLISDALIRVVDVHWAICDCLVFNRDVSKTSGLRLKDVYKNIQNLEIKIYSLDAPDVSDEKVNLWQLHFDFLDVLRLALGDIIERKDVTNKKTHQEKWDNSIEDKLIPLFEEDPNSNASRKTYMRLVFNLPFDNDAFPLSGRLVGRALAGRANTQYRQKLEEFLVDIFGSTALIRTNNQILSRLSLFATQIFEIIQGDIDYHKPQEAEKKKRAPRKKKTEVVQEVDGEQHPIVEPE